MSVNETDPKDLFGGTWERIKDAFLLACGDTYANGATGGESEVTLKIEQIPSHAHTVKGTVGAGGYAEGVGFANSPTPGYTSWVGMSAVGGGKPHNNMPPYLAVYIWKRIG